MLSTAPVSWAMIAARMASGLRLSERSQKPWNPRSRPRILIATKTLVTLPALNSDMPNMPLRMKSGGRSVSMEWYCSPATSKYSLA